MLPAHLLAEHGFGDLRGFFTMVLVIVILVVILIAGAILFSVVGLTWLVVRANGGRGTPVAAASLKRFALVLTILGLVLGGCGVISLASPNFMYGGISTLLWPLPNPDDTNDHDLWIYNAFTIATGAAELAFAAILLTSAAFSFSRAKRASRIELQPR